MRSVTFLDGSHFLLQVSVRAAYHRSDVLNSNESHVVGVGNIDVGIDFCMKQMRDLMNNTTDIEAAASTLVTIAPSIFPTAINAQVPISSSLNFISATSKHIPRFTNIFYKSMAQLKTKEST